jgi:hypothetical protein
MYSFVYNQFGAATYSSIIDYMRTDVEEKYKISKETSRKVIADMISKGIFAVSKPERTGLPHYVSINPENEFNKIAVILTSTKKFINVMEEPMMKIDGIFTSHGSDKHKIEQHGLLHAGGTPGCFDCQVLSKFMFFVYAYHVFVNELLDLLLIRTNKTIPGREQESLYRNIVLLKIKVIEQARKLGHTEANLSMPEFGKEESEYLHEHGIQTTVLINEAKNIIRETLCDRHKDAN